MPAPRKSGRRWKVGRSPVKFKSRASAAKFARNMGRKRGRRR